MTVICYFIIVTPNTEVQKVATTVAPRSCVGIKKYYEGIQKGIHFNLRIAVYAVY